MFLKQVDKFKTHSILFFILPVLFLMLMVVNYIMTVSLNLDPNTMIKQSITDFGINGTFIMMIFPLSIGLLVLFFWVKIIQNQTLTSLTTAREKIDWKRIFFSFLIWSLFTIIIVLVSYFSSPEDFQWNFKPIKFFTFLALALLLIPMQTSFEEYLFRGNLMQGLFKATHKRWIALLLPAFLFGIMHAGNPEVTEFGAVIMVYYIGTGLFLGVLTLMDEGLELALGFHASNNLIGALLLTSDWTVFQTHSLIKDISTNHDNSVVSDILFPVFVLFPILLFIYSKVYKWTNWKEKLIGLKSQEFTNQ